MPLLNYTTGIDAFKTIAEIQQLLVKAGASAVLNEFDDTGNIVALSFKMKLGDQDISFRLPTDWRPVLAKMKQDKARGGKGSDHIRLTEDQARRVAWRITKDWVEAQLAIIETRMVTTAQVFLPYAVTANGQSLYEYVGSNTTLLHGSGEKDSKGGDARDEA
jgi:hypothetical protein